MYLIILVVELELVVDQNRIYQCLIKIQRLPDQDVFLKVLKIVLGTVHLVILVEKTKLH